MTEQQVVGKAAGAKGASELFTLDQVLKNDPDLAGKFLTGFKNFHAAKSSELSENDIKALFNDIVCLRNTKDPLRIVSVDASESELSKTQLKGIQLLACKLCKSDFSESDLRGSSFVDSNLAAAQFLKSKLANSDFTDATLVGADFENAKAYLVCFARANLSDATLKGQFGVVHYPEKHEKAGQIVERVLTGYGPIQASVFKGAILLAADMEGGNFEGCNFSDAKLINAFAKNANFRRAIFKGAELDGADFSFCDIRGVDFRDSDLGSVALENALYDENTKFSKNGLAIAEEAGAITIELAQLLPEWKGRLN